MVLLVYEIIKLRFCSKLKRLRALNGTVAISINEDIFVILIVDSFVISYMYAEPLLKPGLSFSFPFFHRSCLIYTKLASIPLN